MHSFLHFLGRKSIVLLALILVNHSLTFGQKEPFSFEDFRSIVLSQHPIAKQANLRLQTGESTERMSRGAFDPKLEYNTANKEYGNKQYYHSNSAQLKIPTLSAIDLKAVYDNNTGVYLNPADNVPNSGLYAAGISVNVLQGLMIDERRAALKKAQLYIESTKAERDAMINQLLFDAYQAYWNWWNAVEKKSVAGSILSQSQDRFRAVKERMLSGDRAAIDTVEASLQVQLRRQNFQEASMAEIKSRYLLSNFIWKENGEASATPMVLGEQYVPTSPAAMSRPSTIINQSNDSLILKHPELRQYNYKIKSLHIDERWKKEKLKPKLNVDYNFLTSNSYNSPYYGLSTANYKWGLQFSFPLFLRESRGDLQLTRIKIQEAEMQRNQKQVELQNKLSTQEQTLLLLEQQLAVAREYRDNYRLLLNAERDKFFVGESSLFIINQRESSLSDAENKIIDLQTKILLTENERKMAVGRMD